MTNRLRPYTPKNGRLKAASTCKEKGWGVGTWLNSASWKKPRKIESFDGGTSEFVSFVSGEANGFGRVMIFPADVHEIPKPPTKVRTHIILVKELGTDNVVHKIKTKATGAAYRALVAGIERKTDTERYYVAEYDVLDEGEADDALHEG